MPGNSQKKGSFQAGKQNGEKAMQNIDFQTIPKQIPDVSDRVGHGSVPAGCITKKWLCFTLQPSLKKYRSETVRLFFTQERLERCGIAEDNYRRIRVFSPEATHVILSDLQKFGFIK